MIVQLYSAQPSRKGALFSATQRENSTLTHPAILKQRLGLKGNLGDVYIQIFANDGSYIQFATHPLPSKKEVVVKLPLSPPLQNGWEARPLMAKMKKEALAKYNVVSRTGSATPRAHG